MKEHCIQNPVCTTSKAPVPSIKCMQIRCFYILSIGFSPLSIVLSLVRSSGSWYDISVRHVSERDKSVNATIIL